MLQKRSVRIYKITQKKPVGSLQTQPALSV